MEEENKNILHAFDTQATNTSIFSSKLIIILVAAALLGVGSGYLFSRISSNKITLTTSNGKISESSIVKGMIIGSDDLKTFSDTAEGIMKEGGVDGEGQFHLERPGGASQNVYLTSSTVDLSQFIDRKVKVNGQTNKAQTAGWLMDVGRVEVME